MWFKINEDVCYKYSENVEDTSVAGKWGCLKLDMIKTSFEPFSGKSEKIKALIIEKLFKIIKYITPDKNCRLGLTNNDYLLIENEKGRASISLEQSDDNLVRLSGKAMYDEGFKIFKTKLLCLVIIMNNLLEKQSLHYLCKSLYRKLLDSYNYKHKEVETDILNLSYEDFNKIFSDKNFLVENATIELTNYESKAKDKTNKITLNGISEENLSCSFLVFEMFKIIKTSYKMFKEIIVKIDDAAKEASKHGIKISSGKISILACDISSIYSKNKKTQLEASEEKFLNFAKSVFFKDLVKKAFYLSKFENVLNKFCLDFEKGEKTSNFFFNEEREIQSLINMQRKIISELDIINFDEFIKETEKQYKAKDDHQINSSETSNLIPNGSQDINSELLIEEQYETYFCSYFE